MEEYPKLKFIVTVEFTHNRKPDNENDTVFHFNKFHYGLCNSLNKAKEKRNEILETLVDAGYRVITQIKDAPNSYTASVMCRAKGTECKVIIKDLSESPLNFIKKNAEKYVLEGKEFVKWEFGE